MTQERVPGELSAEEVAHRIGAVGSAPGPERAVALDTHTAAPAAERLEPLLASRTVGSTLEPRAGLREPGARPPEPRARLIRDTAATLAILSALALIALAVWPPAPDGGVLSVAATPAGSAPTTPVATPSPAASPAAGSAPAESPVASPVASVDLAEASVAPLHNVPGGDGSGGSASTPRPRPSATPRARQTPTPGPGATPTPTPGPTSPPTPTPEAPPTPSPEPTPTPDPTPTPTPDPTPTSTPEPTPAA